jgi:hypothetical protein
MRHFAPAKWDQTLLGNLRGGIDTFSFFNRDVLQAQRVTIRQYR